MIIGIDKGHSVWKKSPCGAIGLLNESKENRPVGDKVILKLIALGHTVIDCSCDSANSVDEQLAAIVKKANSQKLDLFLSLHLNAGGGTGAEIYTTNTSGAKQQAKKLIDTYCNRTGFKNRGHKYAEFYVLRHTVAPAMLIEMAFVDTEADYKKWNDLGAELIANAIVEGITGQVSQEKPVEDNKPQNKGECKVYELVKDKSVVRGSTGSHVYLMQSMLKVKGMYEGVIDGKAEGMTEKAIINYNTKYGLSNGNAESFGPKCWYHIFHK